MSTVYSLIAFGGKFGAAVSLSVGSPCYVGYTNPVPYSPHGVQDGTPVVFADNGDVLPTGLAFNTTYYTRSNWTNEIFLFTTKAAALANDTAYRINTTGSQSGTHRLKSKEMLDLIAAHPDRWGAAEARVFDSLASWNAGRAGADPYDSEICEIGMAWDDHIFYSAGLVISVPSLEILITTKVDSLYTSAFHQGIPGTGYKLRTTYDYGGRALTLRDYRCRANGFTIKVDFAKAITALTMGTGAIAEKMICIGAGAGTGVITNAFAGVYNSLIYGFDVGVMSAYGSVGNVVASCTIVKNTNGFSSGSSGVSGFVYANISVGNTTNWRTGISGPEVADKNMGLAGEAWTTSGKTRLVIATTDFADFANNDFRPATSTSPQVDTGVLYYGIGAYDIADDEMPNYNNGDSEAVDVGCYEFDHGYGPHPASTTVTFTGVNADSEIRVYNASGAEIAGVESCDANHALTWNVDATALTVRIVHTAYKIKEFQYTNAAGTQSLPVQQEADKWYSNPI